MEILLISILIYYRDYGQTKSFIFVSSKKYSTCGQYINIYEIIQSSEEQTQWKRKQTNFLNGPFYKRAYNLTTENRLPIYTYKQKTMNAGTWSRSN